MKISVSAFLKKLGLRERFPRSILHSQKSQLEVGTMELLTTLAVLLYKLHLGHERYDNHIANQMRINECNASFQCGYSSNVLKIYSVNKLDKIMQSKK